jgi:hypothetical protein
MTEIRKWSLLTALAVVVVLAAGWFLLVAPKRSEAADLRQQTRDQLSANDSLQLQIAELEAQAVKLPEQRARLAEVQASVPAAAELPALIRTLTTAARASGVDLVSLAPGPLTPLAGTGATAIPTAAPTATASAGATTAPAGTSTAAAGGLEYVPVTLTTKGSFVGLKQFLNELEGLDRSFLTSGVSASGERDDVTGSTKLTATIIGRVFVSPAASTAAPVTPTTTTGQ